jgi:hypothetical protein
MIKRWSEAESFTIFEIFKIIAYYSVIFCHKFGDFFSLKIMAFFSGAATAGKAPKA